MKSEQQNIIKIEVGRSLTLILILLWLLIFFFPALVVKRVFQISQENSMRLVKQKIRQELMNKARESQTQFNSELVFNRLFDAKNMADHANEYFNQNRPKNYLENSLVKILPQRNRDGSINLKAFADRVKEFCGIPTSFVFYGEKDPTKCSFIAEEALLRSGVAEKKLLDEIALMAKKVNFRFSRLDKAVELSLRTLYKKDFPEFHRLLGLINDPSIDLFRISINYSSALDDVVYLVSMRYPGREVSGRHVFIGFRRTNFPAEKLLREFLREFSTPQLQVRFGYSRKNRLPDYFSEDGRLILLFEAPAELHKFSRLSIPKGCRPVFSLEYDLKAISYQTAQDFKLFSSLLNMVLMISLILTLAIAFARVNIADSIRLSVMAALFGSCLLPVIGLGWLSFAYSSDFHEHQEQRVVNELKGTIREVENDLRTQKVKMLASMKSFAYLLEEQPEQNWPQVTDQIDPTLKNGKIRKHQYYNYMVIDRWAREFGRKRFKTSRGGELRPMMLGSSYKLLYDFGAFADKPAREQSRIAQFAEVSSGLTEQISDPEAQSKIFACEGEFFSFRTLPLEQLLGANFLRKDGKLLGIFSMLTNANLFYQYLATLIHFGVVKTNFEIDGFKVNVHLFRISSINERSLHLRIFHAPGGIGYESDELFHRANSLYKNSDSAQVNNLGKAENSLVLCDVIFNRQVFAMAVATPTREHEVNPYINLLLILIISSVSSLCLALGISNHLLRPIPPFVAAIKRLQNQDFSWEINCETSDQFSVLARSFNHMTIKMQERKKMLSLVSKVAIDAVADENLNEHLQPRYLQGTILFSDIRSFTTISERYAADQVVSMLNDYLSIMCQIIEKNGGFIDKIIGDAIQAVFFATDDDERAVSAACAALQMRQALHEFNRRREQAGEFAINNGVGIASGRLVSGLVGSDSGKLDATVFGMPLVLAQNLESLSKQALHSHILIDAATAKGLKKHAQLKAFSHEELPEAYELISLE